MSPATHTETAPCRGLPVVLLLFFASGCAALIYEIVWFQLLQLVIGSDAVSLAVLLGTFMGGMCLGSLVLPRLLTRRHHPLRVYAFLELGIGIIGIALLFGLPEAGQVYSAHAGRGLAGILLRGLVCSACLLLPTMLMGATFPVATRWAELNPKGASWWGLFYASNLGGALFGCLLAGFYLLRVHDMTTASWVAAAINGAVALTGLGLAGRMAWSPPASQAEAAETPCPPHPPAIPEPPPRRLYFVIALSGCCALGCEVLWTRLLSLLLGGTVYTFSLILAVFLSGLGLGSGLASLFLRSPVRPRMAVGWCQFLAAAGIAWTGGMVATSLPYWPINPFLSKSAWATFQIDLVRCLWAVLPATVLWGASFPLALAALAWRAGDAGRLAGGVYAANTLGAIVGAVGTSLVLITWLGTQNAQRVLIGLSALAGVLAWTPLQERARAELGAGPARPWWWPTARQAVSLGLALAAAAGCAWSVPRVPGEVLAYGRYLTTRTEPGQVLFAAEGLNASVAVSELPNDGVRNFHVSGRVEASSDPQDMRLQLMLGYLPALVHPKPRSALIVGCGAGVTAGSFVLHPDIQRIVICEIEPLVPQVVARYFAFENHHVLENPRVEVIYDDARHYLLTSRETFDIITSDPIHPWMKGSAMLYTQEYFELVRRHLNPGGCVTQWVPLYESTEAVVKSEIATFCRAFPGTTVWSNDYLGEGYDTVLLGRVQASRINVDEIQARLDQTNFLSMTLSLDGIGFKSVVGLLTTYCGRGSDLEPWLRDAQLNRDRNLRLQYLAGLALNVDESRRIFENILEHRTYPERLFIASEQREQALRKALAGGSRSARESATSGQAGGLKR